MGYQRRETLKLEHMMADPLAVFAERYDEQEIVILNDWMTELQGTKQMIAEQADDLKKQLDEMNVDGLQRENDLLKNEIDGLKAKMDALNADWRENESEAR